MPFGPGTTTEPALANAPVPSRLRYQATRSPSRLAAITSGGAIPEMADYDVVEDPSGAFLGTVNEDFAIESMAGDIFQLGEARLQLCQPRSPCWKIDERFGIDGMAAFIAEQRLTGWYFRVLQPGTVTPDATLDLVEPAANAATLAAAMTLWQAHRPALEALGQLAATPGIAGGWQRKIVDRLAYLEKQPDKTAPPPPAFHVKPEAP